MPNRITDEELAEIEDRAAFATLGPWEDGAETATPYIVKPSRSEGVLLEGTKICDCLSVGGQGMHDARFIAAARTDIPRLIAEVRALRDESRALCNAVDKILRGMVFTHISETRESQVEWQPMCIGDASHKDDNKKSAWDELREAHKLLAAE